MYNETHSGYEVPWNIRALVRCNRCETVSRAFLTSGFLIIFHSLSSGLNGLKMDWNGRLATSLSVIPEHQQ